MQGETPCARGGKLARCAQADAVWQRTDREMRYASSLVIRTEEGDASRASQASSQASAGRRASSSCVGRRARAAVTGPPRCRAATYGEAGVQRPQPELHGVRDRTSTALSNCARGGRRLAAVAGAPRHPRSRPQGRGAAGREADGDGEEGARDLDGSMETTAVFPNADTCYGRRPSTTV
jgi:hypothetical protein